MRTLRASVAAQVNDLDKESYRIAYAIAKKWERVGRLGTRFVWKELPTLAFLMEAEIDRFLTKFFNRAS
jgi:hypothetical protein